MKLLVVNGPNLNLLGIREPSIYGNASYASLVQCIEEVCAEQDIEVEVFQSNHEGALVDAIQHAYGRIDGIIINAGAYTHTSIALLDALKAVGIPAVEVHLSNVRLREDYRQTSYVREACLRTISGLGFEGYREALLCLKAHLSPF
jgi:3-dehydroquinate dehydratase-2